ncbi:MAG TPA: hypothetical protein VH986_01855, partial [Acidimicrobiia bacterium]
MCTGLLVACTVGVFVGLVGTARDVDRSLAAFYDRTRFADLVVIGGDTEQFAADARAVRGVDAVTTRSTTTLSVWVDDGATKVQGTIIGVPATGPVIDALDVTSGRHFRRTSTAPVAVVEQHTASDLGIRPGDTIEALGLGGVQQLTVTGVATSPEYLLPAQNQQQVVTTPGSFAVVYVPEAVAATLGGPAAVPQALVRYDAGAATDALDARLTRLAARGRADLVETRAGQPSNGVIDEEHAGVVDAAIALTGIAAILTVLVGALGAARVTEASARRRRLGAAVLAGTAAGLLAGAVGARIGTAQLAGAAGLTTHETSANVVVLVAAAALAAVIGALALGIAALDRGRGAIASGTGPIVVTGIAAALAMVSILAPAGIVDSAEATLDAAADLVHTDATVAFATPVSARELDELRQVKDVAAAEPVPSAEIVVRRGTTRYATELQAYRADTTMQDFAAPAGTRIRLPAGGVLIPVALGEILDARRGDEIEVTIPGGGVAPFRVPVAGFISNTLGNLVFLRISTLR